jgi:hypothetical protein
MNNRWARTALTSGGIANGSFVDAAADRFGFHGVSSSSLSAAGSGTASTRAVRTASLARERTRSSPRRSTSARNCHCCSHGSLEAAMKSRCCNDSIRHVGDAVAADQRQRLGDGGVERNFDQGAGGRREGAGDPGEDARRNAALLFQINDLDEGNRGHADAVGAGDSHRRACRRRKSRTTQQRPNQGVRVRYGNNHQTSSRGKPAHISRRASSISSAEGQGRDLRTSR